MRNERTSKKVIGDLKAEEASEHRKLTSGIEEEVGVIQEPRYLADLRGARGTSMDEGLGAAEKKGMQWGKSQ